MARYTCDSTWKLFEAKAGSSQSFNLVQGVLRIDLTVTPIDRLTQALSPTQYRHKQASLELIINTSSPMMHGNFRLLKCRLLCRLPMIGTCGKFHKQQRKRVQYSGTLVHVHYDFELEQD